MSWIAVATVAAGAIAGGASIYGSKQAAKAARPNKTQRELEAMQLENLRYSSPYGRKLLEGGQADLKFFGDFYRRAATGGRKEALSLIGQALRTADQQSAAGLGSELGLAPLSGGSAESRLAGMDALRGGREDALINLQTGAVDTLGALGGEKIAQGSGLLGQSNSSALGLLGSIQNRRNDAFNQTRAAGASAFELMKMLGNYWSNRPTNTSWSPNLSSPQFNPNLNNASGSYRP